MASAAIQSLFAALAKGDKRAAAQAYSGMSVWDKMGLPNAFATLDPPTKAQLAQSFQKDPSFIPPQYQSYVANALGVTPGAPARKPATAVPANVQLPKSRPSPSSAPSASPADAAQAASGLQGLVAPTAPQGAPAVTAPSPPASPSSPVALPEAGGAPFQYGMVDPSMLAPNQGPAGGVALPNMAAPTGGPGPSGVPTTDQPATPASLAPAAAPAASTDAPAAAPATEGVGAKIAKAITGLAARTLPMRAFNSAEKTIGKMIDYGADTTDVPAAVKKAAEDAGYTTSKFVPTEVGWHAPDFHPKSGGSTYAWRRDDSGNVEYIDSTGRTIAVDANGQTIQPEAMTEKADVPNAQPVATSDAAAMDNLAPTPKAVPTSSPAPTASPPSQPPAVTAAKTPFVGASGQPYATDVAGVVRGDIKGADPKAVSALQTMQGLVGSPLTVVRGASSNLGGTHLYEAGRSDHDKGLAFDISIDGMSDAQKLQTLDAAKQAGFTDFGLGQNDFHVGMSGTPRAWTYGGTGTAGIGRSTSIVKGEKWAGVDLTALKQDIMANPGQPISSKIASIAKAVPQSATADASGALTGDARDKVIRTVIGEAVVDGPQGMQAVAETIKNRADAGTFPGGSDPGAVATDPSQYSTWMGKGRGGNDLTTKYGPGSPEYELAAKQVDGVFNGTLAPITNGAVYSHANVKNLPSYWNNLGSKVVVGNQVFGAPRAGPAGAVDALAFADRTPTSAAQQAAAAEAKGSGNQPTLRQGRSSRGQATATRALQTQLNQAMPWANLKVDGSYGTRTAAAVKAFQKLNGAKLVDGVAGPETWALLNKPPEPAPALATAPTSGPPGSASPQPQSAPARISGTATLDGGDAGASAAGTIKLPSPAAITGNTTFDGGDAGASAAGTVRLPQPARPITPTPVVAAAGPGGTPIDRSQSTANGGPASGTFAVLRKNMDLQYPGLADKLLGPATQFMRGFDGTPSPALPSPKFPADFGAGAAAPSALSPDAITQSFAGRSATAPTKGGGGVALPTSAPASSGGGLSMPFFDSIYDSLSKMGIVAPAKSNQAGTAPKSGFAVIRPASLGGTDNAGGASPATPTSADSSRATASAQPTSQNSPSNNRSAAGYGTSSNNQNVQLPSTRYDGLSYDPTEL